MNRRSFLLGGGAAAATAVIAPTRAYSFLWQNPIGLYDWQREGVLWLREREIVQGVNYDFVSRYPPALLQSMSVMIGGAFYLALGASGGVK